jgi:fructokinase
MAINPEQNTQKVGTCVGAGYIALDVVFNELLKDDPSFWAGGSCGNILTILSYWNWNSYPLSRLGKDVASKYILKDIKSWGVSTKFISTEKNVDTPIVIERIKKQKTGRNHHKFEWTCPNCGSRLPRYRPILLNEVSRYKQLLPVPEVFYFDRISKSTFEIASFLKTQGSIIFFEPSSVKNSELFEKCLQISNVVKYSDERIDILPLPEECSIFLEIQTLGENGLRFRYANPTIGRKNWVTLKPYKIAEFSDSTGSGDWCSAGIIHNLGKNGALGISQLKEKDIKFALNYGQAFASLNCMFDGARGLMYSNLSSQEIGLAIEKIRKNENIVDLIENNKKSNIRLTLQKICKNCRSC